jgi:hypothetical protein
VDIKSSIKPLGFCEKVDLLKGEGTRGGDRVIYALALPRPLLFWSGAGSLREGQVHM